MNITPQQAKIIELHRDMQWHCSTEYEFIRDHRKRISELNQGYLKEKGHQLTAKPCDGTPRGCKRNHNSAVAMRRAEKIATSEKKPVTWQEAQTAAYQMWDSVK